MYNIQNILVAFVYYADYTVLSPFTSLAVAFAKQVLSRLDQTTVESNRFYEYVRNKPVAWRSVAISSVLLVITVIVKLCRTASFMLRLPNLCTKYASSALFNNKEFVIALLEKRVDCWLVISERVRKDPDVAVSALTSGVGPLVDDYDPSLFSNAIFARALLSNDLDHLSKIDQRVREDQALVLEVFMRDIDQHKRFPSDAVLAALVPYPKSFNTVMGLLIKKFPFETVVQTLISYSQEVQDLSLYFLCLNVSIFQAEKIIECFNNWNRFSIEEWSKIVAVISRFLKKCNWLDNKEFMRKMVDKNISAVAYLGNNLKKNQAFMKECRTALKNHLQLSPVESYILNELLAGFGDEDMEVLSLLVGSNGLLNPSNGQPDMQHKIFDKAKKTSNYMLHLVKTNPRCVWFANEALFKDLEFMQELFRAGAWDLVDGKYLSVNFLRWVRAQPELNPNEWNEVLSKAPQNVQNQFVARLREEKEEKE